MKRRTLFETGIIIVLGTIRLLAVNQNDPETKSSVAGVCPPFYLKDEAGSVIDPVHNLNADKPYSPKQTCGAAGCHDYRRITEGFHFTQGQGENPTPIIPTDKSPTRIRRDDHNNGGQAIHLRLMFHRLAANRPVQKRPRRAKSSAYGIRLPA